MKKNKLLLFFSLLLSIFISCKKDGEIITDPSFGKLKISGSVPVGSQPLLLQVDGKFRDTLTISNGSVDKTVVMESGSRKVSILDNTQKILTDTTLNFTVGKTNTLPVFLYTGSALLFDDLVSKPATTGNALMRFMTGSVTLPEVMNIEIQLIYTQAGARKIVPLDKKLNGIRKDKFSTFIELAPPASLAPTGTTGALYVVTATDAATGAVVMNVDVIPSSTNNSYATLRYSASATSTNFIANAVVSLAIGDPGSANTKIRASRAIFARIAN